MPVDLKPLVDWSYLPELWQMFSNVIGTTSPSEYGYSLSNLGPYLQGAKETYVSYEKLWTIMRVFLSAVNNKWLKDVKAARKRGNNG